MADRRDAFLAITTGLQAAGVMAGTIPAVIAMRERSAEGKVEPDEIRFLELVGAGAALAIGATAAVATESPAPLLASAVVAGGIIVLYEWALRRPERVEDDGGTDEHAADPNAAAGDPGSLAGEPGGGIPVHGSGADLFAGDR